LGDIVGNILHGYSQPAARNFSFCFQIRENVFGHIDGNGKADSLAVRHDGRINTDDFPLHIKERAAAVAGIDRGVCLNKVIVRSGADDPSLGADNSCGYRRIQTERIADRNDPFPDSNFFRISDIRNRQAVGRFDFNQGYVCVDVRSDDFGIVFLAVGYFDADFIRLFHHVIIGEDITVIADDKS